MLDTKIEFLKEISSEKAKILKSELNICTLKDAFEYYPFRYLSKENYQKISQIDSCDIEVQIIGKIISLEEKGSGKKTRLSAVLKDDSSLIELIWFNKISWVKKIIKLNEKVIVYGKPNFFKGSYSISHPEIEVFNFSNQKLNFSMQGVYSSNEKLRSRYLNSRGIYKIINKLINSYSMYIDETLSNEILKNLKLISKKDAIINIHSPKSKLLLKHAKRRLKFEEFFFIQLSALIKKKFTQKKLKSYKFKKIGYFFNNFFEKKLEFELTNAQKKVIKQIRKDLNSGKQMNRLLQGDVGSGKTIIAIMSMLIAKDNGFQSCFIAPTEILANQHFNQVNTILSSIGIKVNLLTGSTKFSMRKKLFNELIDGKIDILIGTHAIFEENVKFKNLGISIIDEQHRFGVSQRSKMWSKNINPPHILVMTATPIPRTLAMTLYGDLDLSIIDELPPGRKPISTLHKFDSNRLAVFEFIKKEISKGRQIYIVYPLIEESKVLDYKDLMDGYESICRHFLKPDYQISILHGKMKSKDKEYEMERFIKGNTNIMIATTVIEVGVNIPNASVMIIESAERFGLSQLHQLRGRVGRGVDKSYCILMSSNKLSNDAKFRLSTMVKTQNGFEIADADLKLRGPGDLMGTKQSGDLNLKIGDLSSDFNIIKYARYEAKKIIKNDPKISHIANKLILREYKKNYSDKIYWSKIS